GGASIDGRGGCGRGQIVLPHDLRAAGRGNLAGGSGAVREGRRLADVGGAGVSIAKALAGIPAPEDRWDDASSEGLSSLEALVYRSNLLGSDRALANQGGGNTSSKGTAVDHAGNEQRVLWVKGSGTDLASITPAGFAALRLDEIASLRQREEMDDASMVDFLRRCALDPDQPR